MEKVSIVPFRNEYANDFASLNLEWLEKYFQVEEYDRKVLHNPREYILDKGGYIFIAVLNEKVVGTVALIFRDDGVYELSKMAVSPSSQGKRIGQKLMYHCINFAGHQGWTRVFLDSSRKLTPALTLYRKVGFKEIPVPDDTPYERCDIRMELMI